MRLSRIRIIIAVGSAHSADLPPTPRLARSLCDIPRALAMQNGPMGSVSMLAALRRLCTLLTGAASILGSQARGLSLMSSLIRSLATPLLVLLLMVDGVAATFLTDGYAVRVWQTDDGLPQNMITSAVQTHDGYLWFGTHSGLARFDGER